MLELLLRLLIASIYDELIAMISNVRADLAYIGPTPYVAARNRAPIHILAGEAKQGQAFYQSAFVVRADSPIASRQIARGGAWRLARLFPCLARSCRW